MRTPLFLITDNSYKPLGAIAYRDGRFVGHDTNGNVLFNRKDWEGALRAGKQRGLVVTTAWYGVS